MSEQDYAYDRSESHLKQLQPEDWLLRETERLYGLLKEKGIDPNGELGADKKDL